MAKDVLLQHNTGQTIQFLIHSGCLISFNKKTNIFVWVGLKPRPSKILKWFLSIPNIYLASSYQSQGVPSHVSKFSRISGSSMPLIACFKSVKDFKIKNVFGHKFHPSELVLLFLHRKERNVKISC